MSSDKVLVTYASRGGSTRGVAEAVAKTLSERGAQVEVLPMKEVKDLAHYRAVVAGSPVRGGRWLPEAMAFVRTHQAELSRKPFAAFMTCITLSMPGAEKYRQGVAGWLAPVRMLVRPVSEGLFAGELDFRKLPVLDTLGMRAAVAFRIFRQGDYRDWNAIRAWAERIHPLL